MNPGEPEEPEFVRVLKQGMREGRVYLTHGQEEEPMTHHRPLTHTTLENRRNQQVCEDLNCGHPRGVHYANMPYTSPNGLVTHCARCVVGENVCGGFRNTKLETRDAKMSLTIPPAFEAYLGKSEAEWVLRLWEGEGHAQRFLKHHTNGRPHVYRVRVEILGELELVEQAAYLRTKRDE